MDFGLIAAALLADTVQRGIDDALGNAFFAMLHDGVDELREHGIAKLGVREDLAFIG